MKGVTSGPLYIIHINENHIRQEVSPHYHGCLEENRTFGMVNPINLCTLSGFVLDDHSRVKLDVEYGNIHSDYINADYITGYKDREKAFVATQGK